MTDELYEVRNLFYLGNYQGAVNAAISLNPSNAAIKLDRDVLLYRCYVSQRNYGLVLAETESRAGSDVSIDAVRTFANFKRAAGDKSLTAPALHTLSAWISGGVTQQNATVQVIAASIQLALGDPESALRSLHHPLSLEAHALTVQALLAMNRPDLAESALKAMQRADDEATVTLLAASRVYIAMGADKLSDAEAILRDLADKFGTTPALLSAQAVCLMKTGEWHAAETLLLQASEKSSTEPEILINLAVCALHTGKPSEVVNRYVTQLRSLEPKHPWLEALQDFETRFDAAASQ